MIDQPSASMLPLHSRTERMACVAVGHGVPTLHRALESTNRDDLDRPNLPTKRRSSRFGACTLMHRGEIAYCSARTPTQVYASDTVFASAGTGSQPLWDMANPTLFGICRGRHPALAGHGEPDLDGTWRTRCVRRGKPDVKDKKKRGPPRPPGRRNWDRGRGRGRGSPNALQ